MNVDIDEAQRAVLLDLLERRLSDMSSEIRHTDSPRVRQALRDEREVLRSLLVALEPVAA